MRIVQYKKKQEIQKTKCKAESQMHLNLIQYEKKFLTSACNIFPYPCTITNKQTERERQKLSFINIAILF